MSGVDPAQQGWAMQPFYKGVEEAVLCMDSWGTPSGGPCRQQHPNAAADTLSLCASGPSRFARAAGSSLFVATPTRLLLLTGARRTKATANTAVGLTQGLAAACGPTRRTHPRRGPAGEPPREVLNKGSLRQLAVVPEANLLLALSGPVLPVPGPWTEGGTVAHHR